MSFICIIYLLISLILLYLLRQYIKGGVNKLKHSMVGKVIIITGSSSGLGQYSALDLVDAGAKVVFACRNESNAKKSIELINNKSLIANTEYMFLDLCDFKSILIFAENIKKKYPKIDILMNNAGAGTTNYKITSDGYESTLQGNYLGPCLLTLLLLPHFNKDNARIIFLGSIAHYTSTIKEGDSKYFLEPQIFKDKFCSSFYSRFIGLYSNTKLLIMFFTQYLAKYCEKNPKYNQIKVVSCHPGVCNTGFMRYLKVYPFLNLCVKIIYPFFYYFTKKASDGAQTQLFLAYLDHEQLINGAYYSDCKISNMSSKARNNKMIKEFSDWTFNELSKKFQININI